MISKRNFNTVKRLIAFLLFIVVAISFSVPAGAAPKMNAKLTSKNVLSLLSAYDKDGLFLVKQGKKNGSDFMRWFQGSSRIVDDIDTAVHEQCHAYTHYSSNAEKIYRGNSQFYTVTYTDIFLTKEMASSIPSNLRTFRYSTYISEPSAYLASNINGVYGLLNEFTAYSWGMNNTVCLYDYYRKSGSDMNTWSTFLTNGANDRQAYSEFNYYILHYLYYAKKHYPKFYKQIINNKSFKKAYKFIEKKFRSNIAKYQKDLKKIVDLMNADGHSAYISGNWFFCDGRGLSIYQSNYDMLCKEVKKSKYQNIYKKLIS